MTFKQASKRDRLGGTARKLQLDGYWFQSQAEADLYLNLKARLQNGEIEAIKCQDNVHLTKARFLYKPDFRVTLLSGKYEWHEMKGFETDTWRRNRRLWKCYGPGKLTVWKKRTSGIFISETIIPEENVE